MTTEGWKALAAELKITTPFGFVKQILNFHEGEVKLVGATWWQTVDDPRYLNHSRYWHAQTMRNETVVNWCFNNHGGGLRKVTQGKTNSSHGKMSIGSWKRRATRPS